MLDILVHLKRSKNGWLQGGIFLANLLIRSIRHRIIQNRCRSSIGASAWGNLHGTKRSETLFVLGSGQSIAFYSDRQFEEIKRHDSAGFNFWLLHPLVPTYYIGEFKEASERSGLLWKNLAMRAEEYRNTPVIFKYSRTFWEERRLVPRPLDRIFVAGQLSIPGMTRNSLLRWLKLLDYFNIFASLLPGGLILYRQASLSWLLVFALQFGYRKIVMCGVDLNSPEYFYEVDGHFCRFRGLHIPPAGFNTSIHPTNVPEYCAGSLPITEVLLLMNKVLLQKRGIELYVGSESSALCPAIPVYPWQGIRAD